METARDYAGALIRRVPLMYPCARVTFLFGSISSAPQFLLSPSHHLPARSREPRAPPPSHTPGLCFLGQKSPLPVPTVGPVPTLAKQRPRAQQPEVPPEKGHRCPVGCSGGAWE